MAAHCKRGTIMRRSKLAGKKKTGDCQRRPDLLAHLPSLAPDRQFAGVPEPLARAALLRHGGTTSAQRARCHRARAGEEQSWRGRKNRTGRGLTQDTSSAPRRPIETLAMAESKPVQPAKLLLLLLAFLAYSGAHLLNNTLLAGARADAWL